MPEALNSFAVAHPSRIEIDGWLSHVMGDVASGGPTAEEMRSSLSWRVTAPLRRLRARERLNALRAGRMRLSNPLTHGEARLHDARHRLRERLAQIVPLLVADHSFDLSTLSLEQLLGLVTHQVRSTRSNAELWLIVVAVSGCFPDQAQLLGLARDLRGTDDRDAAMRILAHSGVWTARHHSQHRQIEVVTDVAVAYVDFSARSGFNSGVQRVTRETLKRWPLDSVRLVALTDDGVALRGLEPEEHTRVIDWNEEKRLEKSDFDDADLALVVPWKTTVFLPEIPNGSGAEMLATLARFSSNTTTAIVYDMIPSTSGSLVHRLESLRFVNYLSMLKHFDTAVAISHSAAAEFGSFSASLLPQGLPGPRIEAVPLPIEHIPGLEGVAETSHALPLVLTVGSNEERKNQLAVVYAAEILWREGAQFRLMVVGGHGDLHYTAVADAVSSLSSQGRPIQLRRDIDEAGLASAYRSARFSVLASFHEGYGLPVAESLAVGTPVAATGYGSVLEIIEGGGCLAIDPRDDDSIVDAMRQLLDDEVLTRLEREIDARHDTTWNDYAQHILAAVRQSTKGSR
ncbi:glycosyltransferase [Subtercola vilae]|uniref:glycosyltransferase n=1 Tax=Subtercola vilae TaxID=2056433 RepID=UPI001375A6CF|nr:glycosyltransferase [Subtercola vilae]